MRNFTSASLALGFLALSSAACAIDVQGEGIVARDEKRFTVTGEPELNLRTFDGAIHVRTWDQKEVRVEIERRGPDSQTAAALVVNVTQTGNKIVVEAPNPPGRDGFQFGPGRSVHFIITTPKRVTLDARSGDGSITTDGLVGALVLETGDGAITVKGLDGRLKVHTGDGSIRIDDAVGSVEAETGDGAIDLTGRLEGVTLKTGDGSVRVHVAEGSVLNRDWSVSTGDGAIDVRVPATLNADLDAHTSDGHVRADGFAGVTRDNDRNHLQGRLGTGGRTLRLRSGDGSIVISR